MENSYFRELSRRLRLEGVDSDQREDQLDILLRGEPVFYVSLASDVFLLPAGSNDLEVSELYHQVAIMADEVYGYVEAMKHTPLLRASGLHEEFHLLADFGGAVLAGQERRERPGDISLSPGSGTMTTSASTTATTMREIFGAQSGTSLSAPASFPMHSSSPQRNSQSCTGQRTICWRRARSRRRNS